MKIRTIEKLLLIGAVGGLIAALTGMVVKSKTLGYSGAITAGASAITASYVERWRSRKPEEYRVTPQGDGSTPRDDINKPREDNIDSNLSKRYD